MKKVFLVLAALCLASSAQAETNSFSALMAAGVPVECDFQKTDGSQSGTVKLAGGKMRMDSTDSNGLVHMIRDDANMYVWGDQMGAGMGMIMPAQMGGGAGGPMGGPQVDMEEEMDFTCKPWPVSGDSFEPPSDVQFQDLAAMMAGAGL